MDVLLTAATEPELQLLKHTLDCKNNVAIINNHITVHFAITGIGGVLTTYHLTTLLLRKTYDLAINMGIAGSFTERLPIGTVTVIASDLFADLGVRTPTGFASVFDEKLIEPDTFPFTNGKLICPYIAHYPLENIEQATAITVNTASGNKLEIETLRTALTPDIESMEGAAFFYTCLQQRIPFVALRSISNMVEPRDKSRWNIPLAINNLTYVISGFLQSLTHPSSSLNNNLS